jgi:hypothetical protein
MFPSAGTDTNIRIEKKAKLIPKSKEEKLVKRVKNLHVNFGFLVRKYLNNTGRKNTLRKFCSVFSLIKWI